MKEINEIIEGFDAITLEEMDSVKLMNRVDTKYVLTEGEMVRFLEMCREGYRALEVDGSKVAGYSSLYFDTEGREMYLRHLYGRKTRQKVRTRTYLQSGDTFLEIKRKNNHGRTKKKRIEIPQGEYGNFSGDEKAVKFLSEKCWYKADELVPVLNVTFERITLVNRDMTERMTIDRGLRFRKINDEMINDKMISDEVMLEGIVVVEVKQDGLEMSESRRILRDMRVMPYRISKYCIGTVMTEEGLPHNRFNEKIRYINKLQKCKTQ